MKRIKEITQTDDSMHMYAALDVHKVYPRIAVQDGYGALLRDGRVGNDHYDRLYLAVRHIHYQIPDRIRRWKPGRPRLFDKEAYRKGRYPLERFFSLIKNTGS